MKITKCTARKILDSRGVPTVEVEMSQGDISVKTSVPSGKSTGSKEALEKRDADGRGVSGAIESVNETIANEIIGHNMEPSDIDRLLLELDNTDNKSNLGANAMLGVSIAATKLASAIEGIPIWKFIAETNGANAKLPKLFMNIINGGTHSSGGMDFRLPFQEYIIIPEYESISVSYKKAQEVIDILGTELKERFGEVSLGDEGGYSPVMDTIEAPFELLDDIIKKSGHNMKIAIDAAASEFYRDGKYNIFGQKITPGKLLNIYKELVNKYPILSIIEDPFEESALEDFARLMKEIGDNTLVVGDDLTVTNPSLITEVAEKKAANAVIIKPNQIGTLLEVYEAVTIARSEGWKMIASHRSGETMDSFIADLAVGIGAYGIKAGSPAQKQRKVKYDRLLEIEEEFSK